MKNLPQVILSSLGPEQDLQTGGLVLRSGVSSLSHDTWSGRVTPGLTTSTSCVRPLARGLLHPLSVPSAQSLPMEYFPFPNMSRGLLPVPWNDLPHLST